jgi:PEGA domain-containing protein
MANPHAASSIDLASLAMRARDAYDQKRTKECLTLTKSLLIADPENAEAKALQSAIRSDIQRNFDDARVLLEDARRNDNLQEHRKAAEILLLKILYLDPEHEEAKKLLNSGKNMPQLMRAQTHASASAVPAVSASAMVSASAGPLQLQMASTPAPAAMANTSDSVEPIFAVAYRQIAKKSERKSHTKTPVILAASVVLAGVLIVTGQSHFRKAASATPAASVAPVTQPEIPKEVTSVSNVNPYNDNAPPELVDKTVQTAAPTPAKEAPAPSATVIATPPTPVAPVVPGTLAVSSPTAAEIYQGDKYLGSTPTTLELQAGTYTLEYRHGDLRQTVTHVIKPKETTTAMVTFDVTVQVNARPWAQVSIDGAQRRPLGQTPLSDVKVPVGAVLIFENPNFPTKTYRVTGKETAIQMAFP